MILTELLTLQVQQAIRNVEDSYMMIETATLALQQAEENLLNAYSWITEAGFCREYIISRNVL